MPPALVIVDVQKGFDVPDYWGERNNPQAESNIARLLAAWRARRAPIFHFQHCSVLPQSPLRPGQSGNDFKPEASPLPSEPVLQKNVNSCFIGTDLEQRLRAAGIRDVVVCGITTDHCVSTTARMAANLGFEVTVVSDATATFDRTGPDGAYFTAQQMHDTALASLHGEFARVVNTEAAIQNLHSAAAL